MQNLSELTAGLPPRHQKALRWFEERRGTEQSWPGQLEDGTYSATVAKGIYKPEWTEYALSVRQTLAGEYPDRLPVRRDDGTWSYDYFQENAAPADRDKAYTNQGLMRCMERRVPVGAMIQVADKPEVRYQIWGLALVANWKDGFFQLEGFSETGLSRDPGSADDQEQSGRKIPATILDYALHASFPHNILGEEVEISNAKGRVIQIIDDGAAFELMDFASKQKKKFMTSYIVAKARSMPS